METKQCKHPPQKQLTGFCMVPGVEFGVKRPLVEIMWIVCNVCQRIIEKISPFARVKRSEWIKKEPV